MRVLHFLDTTNRGGAEMQALDVCRNASDAGIDLTFVTAKGGVMETEFVESGAEFIRLGRRFPVDLYLASELRKIIKERNIEIVHGYQAVEGVHLYLAARGLKGVKKVLSFQGGTKYDWKNRRALRFLIPRMDANIVVSGALKNWHRKVDKFDVSSFRVVYNGADPKRLAPQGRDLRKELDVPDKTLLIGMIGNFYREKRKDQLTLCKALPRIFREVPNVHCVFAGGVADGAEDKFADCLNFTLENNISDRVHFLGARKDVPDVLDALDVFVFSSFHEGLPVALAEAMLARVPAVVSDIEPLLEASAEGKYAEVFHLQDADELADRILKLLGDEAYRRDLADNAFRFAEDNFSIGAHLKGLTELYRELLAR